MTRQDGMRRDRDGDLVPEDQPPARVPRGHLQTVPTPPVSVPACPEGCRAPGWLPGPADSVVPCPVCKPDTVARLAERRERCKVCRTRLHPSLIEDGYRTHPECDPHETSGRA